MPDTPTPDPARYDRDAAVVFNAVSRALAARDRFASLSDRSVVTAAVVAALREAGRLLPGGAETRTDHGAQVDTCTCPDVDVSALSDPPDQPRTVKGLDRTCPQHGRATEERA